MIEVLEAEFIRKGCKNRKDAAIAVQVYLELCEVKKYWEVEYFYSTILEQIYFAARKKKIEKPSIFVPITVSEMISFNNLQSFLNLHENSDQKTIYIAIVNYDSTCVYYQVTKGLCEPLTTQKTCKEDQSRKLDNCLKKNREVLEYAALCGIPITLPKKPITDEAGTSENTYKD